MPPLYGRRNIIDSLVSRLLEGRTILLYGPMGSGKTAILEAISNVVKNRRRPCGFSVSTRSLTDVIGALLQAYPSIRVEGMSRRRIRLLLDTAVEAEPGVLLLDHLHDAVPRFKGFLRSLMGTGLGVLYAADTETERDHQRYRALGLAYEEEPVPPLHGRSMQSIFKNVFREEATAFPIKREDRAGLIRIASGRPGWIYTMARLLRRKEYWNDGKVMKELLKTAILSKVVAAYYRNIGSIDDFKATVDSEYKKIMP